MATNYKCIYYQKNRHGNNGKFTCDHLATGKILVPNALECEDLGLVAPHHGQYNSHVWDLKLSNVVNTCRLASHKNKSCKWRNWRINNNNDNARSLTLKCFFRDTISGPISVHAFLFGWPGVRFTKNLRALICLLTPWLRTASILLTFHYFFFHQK